MGQNTIVLTYGIYCILKDGAPSLQGISLQARACNFSGLFYPSTRLLGGVIYDHASESLG